MKHNSDWKLDLQLCLCLTREHHLFKFWHSPPIKMFLLRISHHIYIILEEFTPGYRRYNTNDWSIVVQDVLSRMPVVRCGWNRREMLHTGSCAFPMLETVSFQRSGLARKEEVSTTRTKFGLRVFPLAESTRSITLGGDTSSFWYLDLILYHNVQNKSGPLFRSTSLYQAGYTDRLRLLLDRLTFVTPQLATWNRTTWKFP